MQRASDHAILDLFAKLKLQGEVTASRYRRIGEVNERAVHGDQWGSTGYRDGRVITRDDDWFSGADEVPRLVVNRLMTTRMIWSALLNKARVSATAFPASDEPEDTYASTVANALIEHCVVEENTAEKVHTLVGQVFDHGTAAFKVIFDVEEQRACISNVSIFDYLIDSTPDYRDAKWVLFERWIDVEEAEELWKARGLVGAPPTGTQKVATGDSVDGRVQCWELYHRPTRAHPRGLYAFICGGEVTEDTEFPYVFTDDSGKEQYVLPIVVAKGRQVRGAAFGGTNLTDAVPLQRLTNEFNARALQVTRKTSGIHAWVPEDAPEEWDPAIDSVLRYGEGKAQTAPQFLQPPAANPAFERQRDYYEAAIAEVIGINEVTSGQNTTSRSGVAQEQLFELDAAKNADASKSIEQAVLGMFKLWLQIVARFYPVGRKVRITGDTHSDIVQFDGADIQGVDVRLESASEIDKRADVQAAAAQGRMQAGLATQQDVDAATKSPGFGMSKRIAEKLVSDFLAGVAVDPKPGTDFDPKVFADVVQKAKSRALASGSKDDWVALAKLEKQVEQLALEAADQTPAQPAQTDNTAPPAPEAPQ